MEQVNKLKKLTGLSETERKIETAKIVKNKSSVFQKDEMTKRNFYLQLFRTYNELPFKETIQSFVKVFNDVFVKEKPQVCQKYFLTEVNICELDTSDRHHHELH